MPITQYGDLDTFDTLFEGQVALTEHWIPRSGRNTDSIVIAQGRGVCKGATDDALILPVDANSIFMGIAIEFQGRELRAGVNVTTDGLNRFGYAINEQMGYVIRGVIGVLVDQNVTKGSPAFCRFTAATGNSQKGVFRADNGGGTVVAIAVPNSRFMKTAAAGSVVPLSINLA